MNKFLCVITCMDGRIQKPVLEFLEKSYPGYNPDTITEPGPVKLLTPESFEKGLKRLQERIDISLQVHRADKIFLVAHPDCAGNPVSDQEQIRQLKAAQNQLKKIYKETEIHVIWVENNTTAKEI